MASADSETRPGAREPTRQEPIPQAVKIIVAGGFGAGKTTLVGSVSEIAPLSTEEVMTEASFGVDDTGGVEDKTTTTVALDFGRITINSDIVLYLFGTPGQDRFWFMWDELSEGALGAVVLADTRRLDTCFHAVDFFERRGVPFVVAVNRFDGADDYGAEEVREALDVTEGVPILMADARVRASCKEVLVELITHVLRVRSPALSG
ncbi:ATP/GTP-binding protein [Nocardiopsis sp. EMB25]|uniref:GTP-binding protein n=1 Tax=Nocardiopsis sp. EMB25 TaxID=2835867 RepID=UPI0022850AC4|nr:ATP/GTP-binding protein [Nocardiopsis sp. EMB25]MCY9784696.1 ATP/GTP-binding protein [Nocardiopsis sp. EMB25]